MARKRLRRLKSWLEGVPVWAFVVISAPIWFPVHLCGLFQYRLAILRIVRGGQEKGWSNLVTLWRKCDVLYGSMVGPELRSRIENDAMECFIRKYPNAEP